MDARLIDSLVTLARRHEGVFTLKVHAFGVDASFKYPRHRAEIVLDRDGCDVERVLRELVDRLAVFHDLRIDEVSRG